MIQKILILSLALLLSSCAMTQNTNNKRAESSQKFPEQKVEEVFSKMVAAYSDEDATKFLSYVSADNFSQDYSTLENAIYQDFRIYSIYEINYWFIQAVPDSDEGYYLLVKWEKSFETVKRESMQKQKGQTRFLFKMIDGEYKLIQMAGDELFGDSVDEFNLEIPKIVK